MKLKIIIFCSMAVFFAVLVRGQQPLSKEQHQVQQAIEKMFQALSDRDSAGLKSYCTADVSFYEYGQIWTIDTLIRKAISTNQSADFARSNSFEFINTELSKTTAWASYRLISTVVKDGTKTNIEWLETVVLVKQKRQWKIRHLHSTLIRRG